MYRQPVITTPPVTTLLTIHVFAMMASLGMAPLVKAYVSHRLVLVFLDVFHSFTHLFKVFFLSVGYSLPLNGNLQLIIKILVKIVTITLSVTKLPTIPVFVTMTLSGMGRTVRVGCI